MFEPPPGGLWFVWEYWIDLSRTRQPGMSSPSPFTYSELAAWAGLRSDLHLTSRIIELLIRTDGAFRKVWSEWHKRKDVSDNDRGDKQA